MQRDTDAYSTLYNDYIAQSNFSAIWMGFEILKPSGGGAPVEHAFQLCIMAPFWHPREQ
jgi:hypothetical protein